MRYELYYELLGNVNKWVFDDHASDPLLCAQRRINNINCIGVQNERPIYEFIAVRVLDTKPVGDYNGKHIFTRLDNGRLCVFCGHTESTAPLICNLEQGSNICSP